MGQFKPKVKMETTEPSVTLKLKKGGNVKKMNPGGLAAAPMGQQRVMPAALLRRKEGGKADMAQDKKLVKKAIAQHDAQEHKGGKGTNLKLKTGGVSNSNAGGYKTGGVANSNAGGYKNGGLPKSGIIKSNKGKQTMSDGEFMPTIRGHKGVAEGYKAGGKMCKF
jgi:hypothetical protein